MGAPKQKWTREEEAALKSAILKHGAGKWRAILTDPHFCRVLYLRSNVDLKDKWRNMTVMASGLGSRERARQPSSRMRPASRIGESSVSLSSSQSDDEVAVSWPPAVSGGSSQSNGLKGSRIRLDNLIMQAINNSRELGGSSKTTIAEYIEDQYWTPPNFRRILSGKLKHLSATSKLIKVKRKYRISLPSTLRERGGRKASSISIPDDFDSHHGSEAFDSELASLSSMTPEEVTAYAARVVIEAEEAMDAAEEALREAEVAEAEADAAEAFAEAALRTLK